MPLGQQEQAFIDQLVAAGGRGFHEMEVGGSTPSHSAALPS